MVRKKSLWAMALISILVCSGVTGIENSNAAENALTALAKLPVKGRAAKVKDMRAQFGPAWKDVDRNGCDTRNDILKRDLTNLVFRPSTKNCVVESGMLTDPYSGEVIEFTKGQVSSMEVQIDHVVALADAWQTGAFKLTEAQRSQLANDPLNLLAVKGRLNSQKSDSDAASWLPPLKSYRCKYVARQIAVKVKYGLWVKPAEKTAIQNILKKCPNEPLPN
ncbi:MAG: hypothetical protein RLZ57_269 [Actinomycetota bacterium]|jgi:hypothetical protein